MISVVYSVSITALPKFDYKKRQGPTTNSAAFPPSHTLLRCFLTKAFCHLWIYGVKRTVETYETLTAHLIPGLFHLIEWRIKEKEVQKVVVGATHLEILHKHKHKYLTKINLPWSPDSWKPPQNTYREYSGTASLKAESSRTYSL